jgi:hypothetical protein
MVSTHQHYGGMAMSKSKSQFLKKEKLINLRPERVIHPLFQKTEFFDPLDLPQVRYELLRSARSEELSIAGACRQFGFSREYFYQLDRTFMERGFVSILGSPMGRRPIIALNQEIVNFIIQRKIQNSNLSGEDLRHEVHKNYNVECSRRSIERIVE